MTTGAGPIAMETNYGDILLKAGYSNQSTPQLSIGSVYLQARNYTYITPDQGAIVGEGIETPFNDTLLNTMNYPFSGNLFSNAFISNLTGVFSNTFITPNSTTTLLNPITSNLIYSNLQYETGSAYALLRNIDINGTIATSSLATVPSGNLGANVAITNTTTNFFFPDNTVLPLNANVKVFVYISDTPNISHYRYSTWQSNANIASNISGLVNGYVQPLPPVYDNYMTVLGNVGILSDLDVGANITVASSSFPLQETVIKRNSIITTGDITCSTLNYSFLNPPISGNVAGVSQIIAGNGIEISPLIGTGNVTVSLAGSVIPPGGYLPIAGGTMTGPIYQYPQGNLNYNTVKKYRPLSSYQPPFPSIGPPTFTGEMLTFYNGDNSPEQINFTGWFPQSLVSVEPDVMTQLISGTVSNVYSLANTGTPSPYDITSCSASLTLTNGVHITGGTVYISQVETTKPLTLTFGYPDGTPFYSTTYQPGSFPSTGLFTYTLDYTHTLSTGPYTAYWDNTNSNFSMMVANPLIKVNWCGTLTTTASSFYLMAFNDGGLSSVIYKWFPEQSIVEKQFSLDGTLYGISEQMIGSRNLYFYGLFDNYITLSSTRVNNIFIYNVDSAAVITLQADTALVLNPPIGTNDAVYGVEVDTVNDRTWLWGDFTYVGTNSGGVPPGPLNDVELICGCDFTTTSDWSVPVQWEGINGYANVKSGKLLNDANDAYSLIVWAEESTDGNNPPSFLPFNNIGMNYFNTVTNNWTIAAANPMQGGSITQPVSKIQVIGNYMFFLGSYNNAIAYPTSNVCRSITYTNALAGVDKTVGAYFSEVKEAYNSSNTGFWVNNGIQINVSNVRLMSNNLLVMNTNGYGTLNGGGVMTQILTSFNSLPTQWPITGIPRYSTNFIGGNDPEKILLTCSLNRNNFFYSQTFNSEVVPPTPTDPTVNAINGAKFLVDNTEMDKIVFAGSNQDYSSVSFIAGIVEDNDYNWYWQSQVGALDYYDGATFYPNITSSPASLPNIAQVLAVGNNASLQNISNIGSISSASATITYATTPSLDATLIGDILTTGLSINPDGNLRIKGAITKGSLLAGDGTNTIEFPISSNNLYLKANSSTSSGLEWASLTGVASITGGTNISITGTATVPIVSLSNPLTASLNLGTQNCNGTSGNFTLTNGGSVANARATLGFTSADSVNPNNIKSVLYKTGLTLQTVNDLHTITPIGITYTGSSLYQVQSNGSMRITAGAGAAGYTQITQAVNSGTTLVTTIDNTKYYPDTVITNQNLSTVSIPNPQVDYQRLTLTNLGLTNTNLWIDYGSNVFNFSAFSIDGNNNVWLASSNGFIHIYDNTITNLLYTLQVTYLGGAGTINVFYLSNGYMFIGGIFDTVIDVNGINATPQYSITRVNPSTYLFEPMEDSVLLIRGFAIGSQVFCMKDVNGVLVCGGSFTTFSNGNACNYIGEIAQPYNAGGSQVFNEYANGADSNVYAIHFNAFYNYTFIGGDFANVNVSATPSAFAYCAFYDNGATTWYQVASGFINNAVYIIKPSFAGYILIAGAFASLNGATEAYNAYIEEATPANFASTTLSIGIIPNYKQGYYNGENALIGFDNTFYKSSAYQTWTSLGQVGGAGTVNGINNWNGDWKVILDNHTYVRSHSTLTHACAFTGSFIYDGNAYGTYTITTRNVSQQFIGDEDNSYWSIIGQGVGTFS
jgi:hypothetical protein